MMMMNDQSFKLTSNVFFQSKTCVNQILAKTLVHVPKLSMTMNVPAVKASLGRTATVSK